MQANASGHYFLGLRLCDCSLNRTLSTSFLCRLPVNGANVPMSLIRKPVFRKKKIQLIPAHTDRIMVQGCNYTFEGQQEKQPVIECSFQYVTTPTFNRSLCNIRMSFRGVEMSWLKLVNAVDLGLWKGTNTLGPMTVDACGISFQDSMVVVISSARCGPRKTTDT